MADSVLVWLAAAVAVAVAFVHHGKRSGGAAATALVALVFLGSGCLVEALSSEPAVGPWAATALVAVALFVTYDREPRPGGRAPQVYPATHSLAAPGLAALLILFSLRSSPLAVVLLAPIVAAVPRERRQPPLAFAVLTVAVVAVLILVLPPGESGWPTASSILARFDPSLVGWNLLFLVGGRNFGVLVWYLPALLLLASYRPGTKRGWLVAAVAAGALLMPLLSPHDFIGGAGAVANRSFLPLYAALWFVPARVPRWPTLVVTLLGAAAFLWPAWRAPLATAAGEDRPAWHEWSAASRLPYETTQRHAPTFAEWQGVGVLSRSLTPALRDGERGAVFAAADGPAALMIAAERPLEAVLVDFGPRAASEIEIEGGRAGNTVFRPDGGIRFEIELERPSRSHPIWTGERPHRIYLLEMSMPGAPERPLPVAIMARPRDALPRSLDPERFGGTE